MKNKHTKSHSDLFFSICLALSYVTLVALIEYGIRGHFVWLYAYLPLSILTLMIYGKDKYAAIKGKWRTPELWLHIISLIGGWPGALLGRSWLRHKSQKQPFTAVFWLSVVVNASLFVGSLTPQGQELLAQALALSPINEF